MGDSLSQARSAATPRGTLRVTVELSLTPDKAFELLLEELVNSLARRGIRFDRRVGGTVLQVKDGLVVGHVVAWEPGRSVGLEWKPAPWEGETILKMELRFESTEGGTVLSWELKGWENALGESRDEFVGWIASAVLAPLIQATAPEDFGDWLTDRLARRPSGRQARAVYRDPVYHRPNFSAILDALALTSSDSLLEVGCGGGAFLHEALTAGCRATAVDHSPEMVVDAEELNHESVVQGRLRLIEAKADALPLPSGAFTCAVCTGAFGFFPNPMTVLTEIHRVLADEGRLVLFTDTPDLRGTPAAPEPIASRSHFYEDNELEELAREAGFSEVRVERPDLGRWAREAGLPAEALSLFDGGRGGLLLVARKR